MHIRSLRIRSLGFRTDLALLEASGSTIEDRGTHLVVHTPDNPTYWWGNFLLLPAPAADQAEAARWLTTFEETFPGARHRALGVDGTSGGTADVAAFVAMGLSADASVVMTASAVHPPARPASHAELRTLESADDWAQQVDLALAGEPADRVDREFATRRAAAQRALVERGLGRWWGAFVEGRLRSSMGLFRAGEGLARFQEVKTHPDARGRGLAGTLVHRVSRFGLHDLGARTLVMVADPDYLAIRVYRSVGFTDSERQLGVERPPGAPGGPGSGT